MSGEVFVPDVTWPRESGSKRPAPNLRPGQGALGTRTVPQPAKALVQRTRTDARAWHRLGLGIVVVLLFSGCETVEKYSLTYRVWDNDDLRKFSEPVPGPNLALFEASNLVDVLVQYDAFSEKHSMVKRRSYYLQPNQERILAGKQPEWAEPTAAEGLKPIPVFSPQYAATNLPPEVAAYAVTMNEGRAFNLIRPGESVEVFDLPVFLETSSTTLRLAETPFAVAGDAVMAGAVVAVEGFFLWIQSGAPTH